MEELFLKLLEYYGIDEQKYDFLTRPLSFNDVPNPYLFNGMDKAVEIVKKAIDNHQKIMIYGDYDCDGVMSTSIIYQLLKSQGADVGYYVPSRYIDGYGLNIDRAKQIVEKGYKLLITVDNGITAFDSIDYCKNNGMNVIIIDHHQPSDTLPSADSIIHPQVSNFSKIATSAGFCCFMFSYAFLKEVDPYFLTLGAISIISDMMPLVEFNRDAVRLASENYTEEKYYALDLLKEGDEFNYMSIGMRISPKINAVGRLLKTTKINHLITFLTSDDKKTILEIYKNIEQINENRKYLSKNAEINIDDEDLQKPGIVKVFDIEEGLIGIIANRLLNDYKRPVIVFTYDCKDETILKGSCRAGEGFNIVKCFEQLKDLIINAGGHAFAGGVSIKKDNLNEFSEQFFKQCSLHPIVETIEKNIEINIQDVNLSTYRLINTFSPFGEEWKQPLLKICDIKTSSLTFSKTNEHILTNLGQNAKLVGFNFKRTDIQSNEYIDVYGNMNYYIYRGYGNVQFLLKKYKPSLKK